MAVRPGVNQGSNQIWRRFDDQGFSVYIDASCESRAFPVPLLEQSQSLSVTRSIYTHV